jgi:hypothetical protein
VRRAISKPLLPGATPARRYSLYLLYWCKSTKTDEVGRVREAVHSVALAARSSTQSVSSPADVCSRMLASVHICGRMLTYADVC